MSEFQSRLYPPVMTRASSIDSLTYSGIQSDASTIFSVTLEKPYVSGITNGFTGTSLNFFDYFPKVIQVTNSNNNRRIEDFISLLDNALGADGYQVDRSGDEAYFYIE